MGGARRAKKYALGSLKTCRSAIVHLFVERRVPPPDVYCLQVKGLFKGFSRHYSQLRADGVVSCKVCVAACAAVALGCVAHQYAQEGKDPLPFSAARIVALSILKILSEHHLYFLLSWNLMARTDNVAKST